MGKDVVWLVAGKSSGAQVRPSCGMGNGEAECGLAGGEREPGKLGEGLRWAGSGGIGSGAEGREEMYYRCRRLMRWIKKEAGKKMK